MSAPMPSRPSAFRESLVIALATICSVMSGTVRCCCTTRAYGQGSSDRLPRYEHAEVVERLDATFFRLDVTFQVFPQNSLIVTFFF